MIKMDICPEGKKGTQILVQGRTLVAALYCCQGFLHSSLLRKTNERILIVAAAEEERNGFPYQQQQRRQKKIISGFP
jgi:hypothetical protein